ncbi:MAG: hypothetical protein AB7U82_29580, partial [Blastocatellales bacterium]
ANPWDVQQMLNRNGHRNAPWDDFDSPTPIYWGIPRRFPKTQFEDGAEEMTRRQRKQSQAPILMSGD